MRSFALGDEAALLMAAPGRPVTFEVKADPMGKRP